MLNCLHFETRKIKNAIVQIPVKNIAPESNLTNFNCS